MTNLPPPPTLPKPPVTPKSKPALTNVDALTHVIKTVFPSYIVEVENFFTFFGFNNIGDFMTMDEKDFKTPFSYVVDTTKFYSLNPSRVKLLCTLQFGICHNLPHL
jgi:hypothetical protein